MILQIKMIEQGIQPFDMEAMRGFQAAHQQMYIISYLLILLPVICCLVVAFTARKRGLHDMMAESYVIYIDKGE